MGTGEESPSTHINDCKGDRSAGLLRRPHSSARGHRDRPGREALRALQVGLDGALAHRRCAGAEGMASVEATRLLRRMLSIVRWYPSSRTTSGVQFERERRCLVCLELVPPTFSTLSWPITPVSGPRSTNSRPEGCYLAALRNAWRQMSISTTSCSYSILCGANPANIGASAPRNGLPGPPASMRSERGVRGRPQIYFA